MCKSFSCLVTKSNKVYWKLGVDGHDQLQKMYVKKDKELIDDKDAPNNTFARIEIAPKNDGYLKPDKWVYEIDERVKPNWITKKHKIEALKAHEEWKTKLHSQIAIDRFPENPFKKEAPKITDKHIKLIKEWDSVRDSVIDSVIDSVGNSVWGSVIDSVRDSVRDSVGDKVWGSVSGSVIDSVYGQIGYMFPKIKKWKYTDKVKVKGYPYKSVVKLWIMGLVPVYYQSKWHLYGSVKGKVQSVWEEK